MKALVTSGGGFLGGVIVRQLLEEGYAVRSFSRGSYPLLEALGVEISRGDLAEAEAVQYGCADPDGSRADIGLYGGPAAAPVAPGA